MKRVAALVVMLFIAVSGVAFGQGVQSGSITGEVQSADGLVLPGATVTVESRALQGVRTAVTDGRGAYIFRALPPGEYTVRFEFTGMKTVEKKAQLDLGVTITVGADLPLATIAETLTVTAETPSLLQQSTIGANMRADEIDQLPTSRTVYGVTEFAPGVSDRSPNAEISIAGAFAWDNVFMINGVDVNDNAFGGPTSLFIEDAIEEFQVLTNGISAEYGRFSGGVVNVTTKRGGNDFSGSFRVDLTNSSWRDENPIEDTAGTKRTDKTNKDYQATLGGPIVKDRLWFFGAGRTSDRTTDGTLVVTKIPYTSTSSNDRIEGKLTGTITKDHTVQASYFNYVTEETGPSLGSYAGDLDTFYDPPRRLPAHLFAASYGGVLTSSLFAEVQYSEKVFSFENTGGSSTDIRDSPIFTISPEYAPQHYYNAPYFDNTDPEDRNNRQIAAGLSYFKSTESLGRHDLKLGYENFRSTRTGGNSQSATGYYIYADYLGTPGNPIRDANGKMQPVFAPGENYLVNYIPTRGARIDVTTQSFYLNDKWQFNDRLSANLGVRYEKVRSEATGGIIGADTDTLVPRLAVGYDVKGDGTWKLGATYAIYSGKFTEGQFGDNTPVANPSYAYYLYTGPPGVGRSFAPGFDPKNYPEFQGGKVPTANVFLEEGLSSPKTRELTFSVGRALPNSGYVRATYVDRDVSGFLENFTDTTTGSTDLFVAGQFLGTADNVVYRNTDVPTRQYRALQLQTAYRIASRFRAEAHWTHQFRNHGDFEGEGLNTPGTSSLFGDFPEVFFPSRHYPIGHLDDFQADKVRLWTTYDLRFGRAGHATLGLLYRFDSPYRRSRIAGNQPFSARQEAGRRLYQAPPARSGHSIFFGPRGAEEFDAEHNVDLALNYDVPVFKTLRPWFKLDVRNVLNKKAQIGGSTSVTPDPASALDEFGLRTGYLPTANFRKPSNSDDYQFPREFRVSVGFRF
jgi:outer membrane receptor protein involved in Fe transport